MARGVEVGAGAAAVVLVGDVPDDLLDGVLEGDDAGGAAVLVDDDRHLGALGAQLDEQVGQRHGLGDAGRGRHEGGGGDGDVGAPLVGDADGAAQVDDAHDVVDVAADDGEAGVAGGAGQVHDILGGVIGLEGVEAAAVGHDVDGGQGPQSDGAGEQGGGGGVEGALLGAVAHEGGELAGAAGAAELLGGFDAHGVQDGVGGAVEQDDEGLEEGGEAHEEGGHEAGGAHGVGQGGVLGDELAHDHGEGVDDDERDDHRGASGHGDGQPVAHEAGEQVRQGRLHGVAQEHGGQGDADLGSGQEGGEAPQGAPDGGGALVAGGGAGLDGGGVEGDQGELAGHEQGGAHGEHDADGDHEPVGHAGPSPTWDEVWTLEADESGWGWSEAGEEARCVRVRRLEARRKADRIVTERYHRRSSEAETGTMPLVGIARGTDFSRFR